MFINKMGYMHWEMLKNCQDYGFELNKVKCVVDGCSEGMHSEVGAKLFCSFAADEVLWATMPDLMDSDGNMEYTVQHVIRECNALVYDVLTFYRPFTQRKVAAVLHYGLFTVLAVQELDTVFNVGYCGDGIIIKQKHDGTFEYDVIDQKGTPAFYAYNYIPPEYLTDYKDGVPVEFKQFSKEDYAAIGVATDGLKYVLDSHIRPEFEKLMLARKESAIKRLFNKHHSILKDDVTIAI